MEYLFHPTKDRIVLNQIHFIVPMLNFYNVRDGVKKALKTYGGTSAMLSMIAMYKQHCITMEKYEEMYKTNERSDTRKDLSVGEDLESFIERIKTGKINNDTISSSSGIRCETRRPFLLCLLDEEDRKKLEQKDNDFMKSFINHFKNQVDIPEAEWKASESNLKFAWSVCLRHTYLFDA